MEPSECNECPVCLEVIKEGDIYKTSCNHIFCDSCIRKMCIETLSYTCPMCRNNCSELFDAITTVSTKELFEIYKKIIDSEDSRRLHVSKDLYNIIGFLLVTKNKGKHLLDYLLNDSDDKEFKHMYQTTVVEGKRNFIKIEDPLYDFALALLYYKYH